MEPKGWAVGSGGQNTGAYGDSTPLLPQLGRLWSATPSSDPGSRNRGALSPPQQPPSEMSCHGHPGAAHAGHHWGEQGSPWSKRRPRYQSLHQGEF